MSEASVEVTGKTLEEAQAAAAEQLGVAADQVEYEIVSEPKKIFGVLGGGHYTLRAWRQGESPAAAAPPAPHAAAAAHGEPTPQEVAARAQEITAHIFELIGLEAQVEIISADRDGVMIDIHSQVSQGMFIGRHGDTLDALQFLVGVGANQGEHGGYRVTLDLGGYRKRQEEKLRELAIDTANEAVASGQEAVLPGLKAYERRVVHTALADRTDIETYSEGEGEQRQLVISPKVTPPAE
jgi:spoIIIJ-associated protein